MLSPHPHKRLATAALLLLVALVAALGTIPATAGADVSPLATTLEGGFADFSQTNVETGTLTLSTDRAYDGTTSAFAAYDGGGENGYSRGIWNVNWEDGEDVWFGAAYYLPPGFISNIQGQVDLMRWDNWVSHPNDTDWGGVSIYGSDHHARLLRFGAGRDNDTLVGPFDLPEGRWFTLEIHEHLSAGPGAFSELYLDGAPIGRSSKPNTYGRPIQRIRYGIVAIAEDDQRKPLDLWFDQATAGPEPAAPLGVSKRPTTSGRFARGATVSSAAEPAIGVGSARAVG